MRTMPPRSTSLALLTLLALAAGQGAYAQSSAQPGNAQRLEWPRTFTGQPDFAFTRDEALTEARTRAARDNEALPQTPSLLQLLNDDSTLDPLGLTKPVIVSGTDVSGTENPSGTTISPGQSLMQKLMSTAVGLPTVSSTQFTDISEFKSQLAVTISNTVAGWQPSVAGLNIEPLLTSLVLQAIVTSPLRYAVINQQRYQEGDTFQIRVAMPVPAMEIAAALQKQLPPEGTLPADLYARYLAACDDALKAFANARAANPQLGSQMVNLPVTVTHISERKVLLDVNGQPYALTIRFTY